MNFRLSIAWLTLGCASGTLAAGTPYSFVQTALHSGSTLQGASNQDDDQVVSLVGFAADEQPLSDPAPIISQQATPEPGTWVLAVIGIGLILASTLMRRKTSAAYKRVQRG